MRSCVSAALLVALALSVFSLPSSAETLVVRKWGPPTYRVLQEALDAAAPGDTIFIEGGTFSETTTRFVDNKNREAVGWIDKPLTIIGTELAWLDGPPERSDHVLNTYDDCHFEGLQIKNSLGTGIMLRGGESNVVDCLFEDLSDGVFCGGPGSRVAISDSRFYRCESAAVALMVQAVGTIDRCYFEAHKEPRTVSRATYLAYDSELTIRDSRFEVYGIVEVFGPGVAIVSNCDVAQLTTIGLQSWNSGVIYATDCSLVGGGPFPEALGLVVSLHGRIVAERIRLDDMTYGVMVRDWGTVEMHDSAITNWRTDSVHLNSCNNPPLQVFDFTNNWWGTADSTVIAEGIFDGHDDPVENSHGFVEFWPIRDTPLPVGSGSFGSLKSRF